MPGPRPGEVPAEGSYRTLVEEAGHVVSSLSQQSSYSELPDDISPLILLAGVEAPPTLSQHSSFSELADDISDLILLAPIGTQLTRSLNLAAPSIRLQTRTDSEVSALPPGSVSSNGSHSSKGSFSRSDSNASVSANSSATPASKDVSASSMTSFARTDSNISTASSASIKSVGSASAVRPAIASSLISPITAAAGASGSVLGKRKARDSTDSPSSVPTKGFKSAKLVSTDEEDPFPPVIISHSPSHQRIFNALGLPYGVQYEIARFAAAIPEGYDALSKDELDKIQGLNNVKAMRKIPSLFGEAENSVDDAFAKEIAAKAPWAELDLEDENLRKNPLAGLGLSTEASDWFGGKVHFTGKLNVDPKNQRTFQVRLQAPELGPSDRFARRWGSDRFLTLRLSKEVLNKNKGENLIDFLCRPFILVDRVFRAFDAKDGNVFLVSTNEIVEGKRINPTRTAPGIPSLREFLSWHNALELDSKQTMAKWASRFALGRSNSFPVLLLEETGINHAPDVVSESGSDMTDGAGLINKAGLRLIYHRVEMETWPTAIQCRVLGAKGLLVMHPTDVHETPRIWLRPSQIKVKHASCEDPTLRTIDLLRSSHAKTRCRLPVETIINLAENGVPHKAFIKLIEEALVELVSPMLNWEEDTSMAELWCAVARSGGVVASRLARQETVLARVKGYSERDTGELDEDEEETKDQPISTAWWVDQVSGCPSSLEETVMFLLDSGFTPQTCSVLRDKLHKIVNGCVDKYIDSYRIDLPIGMSVMAFLVPDELGVLEAGEFFLKSSRHDLQTRDGLPTDILLGDALVTRHPCKLPTDVQKWRAVDRPELRHFVNVIVMSVKGPRRAADYLSGGDYDGDKGLVIWQPELVDPFVNAPLGFADEPADLAESFSPKNETVGAFLERTGSQSSAQQLREMQRYLLSDVGDMGVVGKYSNWHLSATYSLGYRHPKTIRLAYMFCKTLDGAKTGLRVRRDVYKQDQAAFDKRPPVWKEAEKKKGQKQNREETNMLNLVRPAELGDFIMDKLFRHADRHRWGTQWGKEVKEKIDTKFVKAPHVVDTDLTAPWLEFVEAEAVKKDADIRHRAEIALLARHTLNSSKLSTEDKEVAARLLEKVESSPECDVELIKRHVETVRTKHKSKIDGKFSKLPIERRQDILRDLSRDFATGPPGLSINADQAARIKASCAYFSDSEQRRSYDIKWSRFPWDVAFRELCLIKTRTSESATSLKPVNYEFYERFTMRMPRH